MLATRIVVAAGGMVTVVALVARFADARTHGSSSFARAVHSAVDHVARATQLGGLRQSRLDQAHALLRQEAPLRRARLTVLTHHIKSLHVEFIIF